MTAVRAVGQLKAMFPNTAGAPLPSSFCPRLQQAASRVHAAENVLPTHLVEALRRVQADLLRGLQEAALLAPLGSAAAIDACRGGAAGTTSLSDARAELAAAVELVRDLLQRLGCPRLVQDVKADMPPPLGEGCRGVPRMIKSHHVRDPEADLEADLGAESPPSKGRSRSKQPPSKQSQGNARSRSKSRSRAGKQSQGNARSPPSKQSQGNARSQSKGRSPPSKQTPEETGSLAKDMGELFAEVL
jgi:hypothetical protein